MSETLTVPTHTAADTFTAFAAVNEAAATERLTTANPGRFIRTIGKDCPAWQAKREFFHNALQAAAKTGGDVKVYPKEIDGIDKLCFLDTGHGMNVDDLRNNLMQLNNSGGGVDDSRFGLGARITGLVWSPLGVEYVTWNGVDTPVRGRLTWSVDGCDVCWAELAPGVYLQPVDIADLPAEIRKAGHGTEVVLLGKHAGHNTFDALDENDTSTRKGKAHILFVNTRYVTLPSNVRVHVAARRDQNGNREMRRNDVTGMRQPFIDLGAYHAVVEVDGATVEVYTLPAEVRKSGWRNGDNAVLGSFVGAVLADGERPEMLEIYDKFEAQQGYRKLQSFGLGPISSRTAVFVHPHGAGAMAQRTNLRVNSQELPWHQWEEQFRANMPAELAALVDAALGAAPKSTKATDAVIEQLTALATSVAHMNLAAFGQMTVLAERHAAGGCGGNNRVGARGGNGNGAERAPTVRGGRGDNPGGTGNAAGGAGNGAQTPVPAEASIPQCVVVSETDMVATGRGGYAGYFEPHTGPNGVLYINEDFVMLNIITNELIAGVANVSNTVVQLVKQVAIDHMTARMLEAVVRTRILCDAQQRREVDFETMTSEDALTATASVYLPSMLVMKRSVADILKAAR